jgi:hypothetical protein
MGETSLWPTLKRSSSTKGKTRRLEMKKGLWDDAEEFFETVVLWRT